MTLPSLPAIAKWRAALQLYTRKDVWLVGILGLSSGWPLLLTLSVMSYWLAQLGVSKSSIGLFALVGVPYNLKFLWAPLVDRVAVPFLTAKFGRRRSWAWVSQAALVVCIGLLGMTNPADNIMVTAVLAVTIAFFSATQDIVLDALRIEMLADGESKGGRGEGSHQGGGAATFIGGYRMALLAVGGGALVLSDYIAWHWVFAVLSLGLVVGAVAVAFCPPSPPSDSAGEKQGEKRGGGLGGLGLSGWITPIRDFFRRPHAWLILLFVVLYKYGDAFGGVMANPFYVDLGFSGTEIGVITKVWGLVATLLGVFIGGLLLARYNIMTGLLVGGILQAATNIFFVLLAWVGKSNALLACAIISDNLTGGIGTAALVAYLSHLCNRQHTATQFALLTSLAAVGRTFLSSGAGFIAEAVSWAVFFQLTMLLAIPALLIVIFLQKQPSPLPNPPLDPNQLPKKKQKIPTNEKK